MAKFRVLADMRFWPTSGFGKVESAILGRKPLNVDLHRLNVNGSYGHPLSTYRIAQALNPHSNADSVFWSAGFVPPLYAKIPVVITVHDLTHLHHYGALKKSYFDLVFRRLFKRCAAIICVSEYTRRELLAWSGLAEDKLHIVHNGVDEAYLNNRKSAELGFKYILYAGNHRPHKNLPTLIKSFALAKLPAENVHLIITGLPDRDLVTLASEMMVGEFVHFVGNVPEAEMPALYRGASAVSYISLYEGFGLPLLEAMASQVPVVTSNVCSMPEVAGDAALIVDPHSVSMISAALRDATLNADIRATLIDRGLRRCQEFNWDRSARQVWSLLEDEALKPRRQSSRMA